MRKRYLLFPALILPLAVFFFFMKAEEKKSRNLAAAAPLKKADTVSIISSAPAPKSLFDPVKAIQNDEGCRPDGSALLPKASFENGEYSASYEALAKANGEKPDDCVRALYEPDREKAMEKSAGSSPLCRFQRALLLTHQALISNDSDPPSAKALAEGKRLMEELQREDPQNGAYYFYAISLGSNEEQREAFRKFLSSQKFDSPIQAVYKKIDELGSLNSTAWLLAIEARRNLFSPNSYKATKMARAFASYQLFPAEQARYSHWLQLEFERVMANRLAEPALSTMDMAIFKALSSFDHSGPKGYWLEQKGFREFMRASQTALDQELEFGRDRTCLADLEEMRLQFSDRKRERLEMYDRARTGR